MKKPSELERKIIEMVEPVVSGFGLELLGVEYTTRDKKKVFSIFIDKKGGVTLEDCADISIAIGPLLDEKNPIDTRYDLEVSSPGLDRPIVSDADFRRNIDELIAVELSAPLAQRTCYEGFLREFTDERIVVELNEPYVRGVKPKTNGSVILIERNTIRTIRKAIRF
jgi:ribosome maturation factor RimP